MVAGLDLSEWEQILDSVKHAHQNISGTTSQNLFSSDVPEDRTRHVTALVISNDSSASQQININKVDESNNASAVLSGFNLPASGNEIVSVDDKLMPFTRLQGGANLEAVPQTSTANVTAFFFDNEV